MTTINIVAGDNGALIPVIMLTDTEGNPLPLTLKVVQQFVRLCEQVREHGEGAINVVLFDIKAGAPVDVAALMKAVEP